MERQHQLNNKWSLWYDDYREYMSSKEYNKNLFLISSFETIEVVCEDLRNFGVHIGTAPR
jgi:hypothetical protein